MNKIIVIVTLSLVFLFGYFTHALLHPHSSGGEELTSVSVKSKANFDKTSGELIGESEHSKFIEQSKESVVNQNTSSTATNLVSSPSPTKIESNSSALTEPSSEKGPAQEISDEEIDKVLPEPFNNLLKRSHGSLREKYKNFVENSIPLDWDTNMKNKMWDAIRSNPYSKFIKIEALDCRSNLCEIRVYEMKPSVWSYIQSGMVLEDWWDIGMSHAQGFKTESGSGVYVLLAKR